MTFEQFIILLILEFLNQLPFLTTLGVAHTYILPTLPHNTQSSSLLNKFLKPEDEVILKVNAASPNKGKWVGELRKKNDRARGKIVCRLAVTSRGKNPIKHD